MKGRYGGIEFIGDICQIFGLSQMRYSGVSLTAASLFWHIFEISGCGVRGAGFGVREGVGLMADEFI